MTKAANGIDGLASIKFNLAASVMQVNDSIVVLHGSKVPVMMRPTQEHRWILASQRYLKGSMFGEDDANIRGWKEEDAGSFVLV